jgi:hypothetical protein
MLADVLKQMQRSFAITTRLVKTFPPGDLAILPDELEGVTIEGRTLSVRFGNQSAPQVSRGLGRDHSAVLTRRKPRPTLQ